MRPFSGYVKSLEAREFRISDPLRESVEEEESRPLRRKLQRGESGLYLILIERSRRFEPWLGSQLEIGVPARGGYRIMKTLRFKKLEKKDYGRVALLGLLLAGIRGTVQIPLPFLISALVDILIALGLIAGIIWIVKTTKSKTGSVKNPCERCGDIGSTVIYDAQSTDITRDYYKLCQKFAFDKPLNLCFSCRLAHESFITELMMLTIEKTQKVGRSDQITKAERDFGNQALHMLALLHVASSDMDAARKILDEKSFDEIKPWLDEQLVYNKTKDTNSTQDKSNKTPAKK